MIGKRKIEVIPFKDFMRRPATLIQNRTPLQTNIYSFFPPITISSFIPVGDPAFALFLIGGSLITVIALSEYLFASGGLSGLAGTIAGIMKLILPIAGYGLIFWFLFQI
ncbi:hypothetical protein [Peribacillus loiseleuriae]|uniref:hypothetical protein n=1 Tax=Peribacillus loiseleuriae TaxID=1679170 RepID=UPI003D06DFE4